VTDDELNEIAARADAATPGPWLVRLHQHRPSAEDPAPDWAEVNARWRIVCVLRQWPERRGEKLRPVDRRNAAFIARARADVPALVAEVRRLRAELAACRRVAEGLAGRVAAQAELLSRRAEV